MKPKADPEAMCEKGFQKGRQNGLSWEPKSIKNRWKNSPAGRLRPNGACWTWEGCVSVWMHPIFALHLALSVDAPYLAFYLFAIYFVYIQDKILKARELPAHFSSKWDYFSAPFFDLFSTFLRIVLLTLFGTFFGWFWDQFWTYFPFCSHPFSD